jgi:membrane protease YdiL (CAAX protease family)
LNAETPLAPRSRTGVRWSLLDIVLVVVFSAVATVVLVVALGGILALAGDDPRNYLQTHVVVFSAIIGMVAYGMIFLAVYFTIVRRRHLSWKAVGFRRPPLLALLLSPLIVLGQLSAVAIMNVLVASFTGAIENPQIASISGGQGFSWLNFVLMLLLAGVVAPIVEETFFRGLLFGWLRSRLPLFVAVILSAAIFAAAHVIPILLPALFAVGIILALAYELSGSLWVSILLHALQNSFAVVLIFTLLALGIPLQR